MGGLKRGGRLKKDGRLGEGWQAEKGGGSLGRSGRQKRGWRLVVSVRLDSGVEGQEARKG